MGQLRLTAGEYKVRTDEHLDNLLPGGESLNENVGRLELMAAGVFLAADGVSSASASR